MRKKNTCKRNRVKNADREMINNSDWTESGNDEIVEMSEKYSNEKIDYSELEISDRDDGKGYEGEFDSLGKALKEYDEGELVVEKIVSFVGRNKYILRRKDGGLIGVNNNREYRSDGVVYVFDEFTEELGITLEWMGIEVRNNALYGSM